MNASLRLALLSALLVLFVWGTVSAFAQEEPVYSCTAETYEESIKNSWGYTFEYLDIHTEINMTTREVMEAIVYISLEEFGEVTVYAYEFSATDCEPETTSSLYCRDHTSSYGEGTWLYYFPDWHYSVEYTTWEEQVGEDTIAHSQFTREEMTSYERSLYEFLQTNTLRTCYVQWQPSLVTIHAAGNGTLREEFPVRWYFLNEADHPDLVAQLQADPFGAVRSNTYIGEFILENTVDVIGFGDIALVTNLNMPRGVLVATVCGVEQPGVCEFAGAWRVWSENSQTQAEQLALAGAWFTASWFTHAENQPSETWDDQHE